MCKLKFRALRPDEIDVRVQSITKDNKRAILLLYKDARVDMALLDEVVGPMKWQREHTLIDGNLYCKVSIWDETTNQWVSKCDVGTESNTEATKGESSDSFKRACFNWGIGRELYTSPLISVDLSEKDFYNGKISSFLKFSVKEIDYQEEEGRRTITRLVIVDNHNEVRFAYPKASTTPKREPAKQETTKQETTKRLITAAKIEDSAWVGQLYLWLDKYRTATINNGGTFDAGAFLSTYYDFDSEGTKQTLLGLYTNHLSQLI